MFSTALRKLTNITNMTLLHTPLSELYSNVDSTTKILACYIIHGCVVCVIIVKQTFTNSVCLVQFMHFSKFMKSKTPAPRLHNQ